MFVSRLVFSAAAAVALTLGFGGQASADVLNLNPCNGQYDAACTYCASHTGGPASYPYSYCQDDPGSYHMVLCKLWINGACYIGE